MHKTIAVLMGPTASGKSAVALGLAAMRPTVIINLDAMQMVRNLRVITARPTPAEESQVEHALYGVLGLHEPTSVARWLTLVEPVIQNAWAQEKLPLLVGGTGMYLKALMEGLAEVPEIPQDIRERIRGHIPPPAGGRIGGGQRGQTVLDIVKTAQVRPPPHPSPEGGGSLFVLLQQTDPLMASRVKPRDTQRILRALEVMEATGISLAEWQANTTTPIFPEARYVVFSLIPPRAELYARIDARFEKMQREGALEEVAALMRETKDLPAAGVPIRPWTLTKPPIYRAHGVPELMAHLREEMTLEEATTKAQQHTRNYAKRQMTWLRNQLPDSMPITCAADIMSRL